MDGNAKKPQRVVDESGARVAARLLSHDDLLSRIEELESEREAAYQRGCEDGYERGCDDGYEAGVGAGYDRGREESKDAVAEVG
ncbi:MAG: hypothetical protein HYZ53_20945 [Planctomycetes bacterium]|nr:hypothetical protein [Planctomycetota bacterium]